MIGFAATATSSFDFYESVQVILLPNLSTTMILTLLIDLSLPLSSSSTMASS